MSQNRRTTQPRRRSHTVSDQLIGKMGKAEYGRLLDQLQAVARPPRRRQRRRKVAA